MHLNRHEFHAILALFTIYVTRRVNCEKLSDTSNERTVGKEDYPSENDATKACQGKKCLDYWMAILGSMHPDLMNIQAIIVKEEKEPQYCDKADRKSKQRYLMCAGSILGRAFVLTSASCLHTATHIRHNIRGTLAVAIAPLKPAMQVIRIEDYKIHPSHVTNPYSSDYLKHNVAILRLACRIEMVNFHKIELPQVPFVQTCEEDNCVVAVYRKIGRTRWVMYQKIAPHVPLLNRRKKEAMTKDGKFENKRTKRKLAEPPNFKKHNLDDEENENWSGPVDNKTIRRIVVRSSDGHSGCALTGAAVMYNNTQVAIAGVTCDDRQSSTKWGYTDLYENNDWIRETIQNWSADGSFSGPSGGASVSRTPAPHGSEKPENHSSCGTCIFNFFIDLGCKDKNGCGNKTGQIPLNKFSESQDSRTPQVNVESGRKCVSSNGVDIEIGIGRGCHKNDGKLGQTPRYSDNWRKSLNSTIVESTGLKKTVIANDEVSEPEKPVTVGSSKTRVVQEQPNDRETYTRKDLPPVPVIQRRNPPSDSFLSRIYDIPKSDDKYHEKVNNEIGTSNFGGNSKYWFTGVQHKLNIDTGAKRDIVELQQSSRRLGF